MAAANGAGSGRGRPAARRAAAVGRPTSSAALVTKPSIRR